jgi:hypothetical protein
VKQKDWFHPWSFVLWDTRSTSHFVFGFGEKLFARPLLFFELTFGDRHLADMAQTDCSMIVIL